MDLYKIIRQLQEERIRIDRLISILEEMNPAQPAKQIPSRRGRKAMSEAEKREVSRRMKAYWAARRGKPPE